MEKQRRKKPEPKCPICRGALRVGEDHPTKPWPKGCDCGAAKPNQVVVAWEKVRPGKTFAGMTLEQFREAVQPAVAMKERESLLRNEIAAVRAQLSESDRRLSDHIQRVVAGVKADIDEGDDSELYDAMGYVRSSQRRTGLTRKKRPPTGNGIAA